MSRCEREVVLMAADAKCEAHGQVPYCDNWVSSMFPWKSGLGYVPMAVKPP